MHPGGSMKTKQVRFVLRTFASLVMFLHTQASLAENCFTQQDSLALPFEVIRIGAPKFDTRTGLFKDANNFPATMMMNGGDGAPSVSPISKDGVEFEYSGNIWANRCVNIGGVQNWECPNFLKTKGNYYRGIVTVQRNGMDRQVRPIFTTYSRANACTRIQVGFALGFSDDALKLMASNNQLTIVKWEERATVLPKMVRDIRLPNGSENTYWVDLCLLDKSPMAASATAISVDYEVQDSRPESSTQNVISQIATMVHNRGKKLIVYTNDLDSAMPYYNGISQNNMDAILNAVDVFSFTVGSKASLGCYEVPPSPRLTSPISNMYANLNFITNNGRRKVDYRKLAPWVNLYDLQPDEASALYSILRQTNMKGIYLPNSNLEVGGSCSLPVNQSIGKLLGLDRAQSFCKIVLEACPNDPSKAGITIDTLATAASNPVRCMQRAQEYYQSCGLPAKSGVKSTAIFVSNGKAVQMNTVNGL